MYTHAAPAAPAAGEDRTKSPRNPAPDLSLKAKPEHVYKRRATRQLSLPPLRRGGGCCTVD